MIARMLQTNPGSNKYRLMPYNMGIDGDLTLSTTQVNFATDSLIGGRTSPLGVTKVVTSIGADRVSVAATTGLSADDLVLLLNLQGSVSDYSSVGVYEFARVLSVSATEVVFSNVLTGVYGNTATQKIVVQRIPQLRNLTINSGCTLTCNDWDGTSGGVLAFSAKSVVNQGTISVVGKGFRGGEGGNHNYGGYPYPCVAGDRGESYNGNNRLPGASRVATVIGHCVAVPPSGGSGGGGGAAASGVGYWNTTRDGGGGAGGSHGSVGAAGTNAVYNEQGGSAGTAYSKADGTKIFLGSGGGGGGRAVNADGGTGGDGGGLIYIAADTFTNTGSVLASGADGGSATWSDDGGGGSGGGAGGTLIVESTALQMGTYSIAGGAAGPRSTGAHGQAGGFGGNGGSGMFMVRV